MAYDGQPQNQMKRAEGVCKLEAEGFNPRFTAVSPASLHQQADNACDRKPQDLRQKPKSLRQKPGGDIQVESEDWSSSKEWNLILPSLFYHPGDEPP